MPRQGDADAQHAHGVDADPQTYTSTKGDWYPSGDQSSSLVYQGSGTVPLACGTGAAVSFQKGGTFTASIS